MIKDNLIIAIDGPSASGKGTLAKKIAQHFSVPYLNTGALYRLVALRALQKKIFAAEIEKYLDIIAKNIKEDELENEELFSEEVGAYASMIAKNSLLRKSLFEFQKEFIEEGKKHHNGAVLDGRDIATIICPEANYKFFITADVEIRAKRRFDQLKKQGKLVNYEEILAQLKQRDENDSSRKDSPLLVAEGAIIIDNGNLSIEEGFLKMLEFIENEKY